MIISQHIPKTAGTSFRLYLAQQFNTCFYLYPCAYCKRVNATSQLIVRHHPKECEHHHVSFEEIGKYIPGDTSVIHGHLDTNLFRKTTELYPLSAGHRYVTWIRDPYERTVSHYYHRTRRGLIRDETLTFDDFAQEHMSQHKWLQPYSVDDFAFIGIVEFREASCRIFEKLFNLPMHSTQTINVNTNKQQSHYPVNPEWLEIVQHRFKQDYELYHKCLEKFHQQAAL